MKRWMGSSVASAGQVAASGSASELEIEEEPLEAEEEKPWWWHLGEASKEGLGAAGAVFFVLFLLSRWTGKSLEWTEVSSTMIVFFLLALWTRRRRFRAWQRLDDYIDPFFGGARSLSKKQRMELLSRLESDIPPDISEFYDYLGSLKSQNTTVQQLIRLTENLSLGRISAETFLSTSRSCLQGRSS
ncbi:MAG: hypothetical protein K0U98_25060 [Deltaproteobacteria bacterium]|nr:hypothetical protein [Deltaproteobacteria bacterium]